MRKRVIIRFGEISVVYEPTSDENYRSLVAGSYHEAKWMTEIIHACITPGEIAVDVSAHTGLWTLPLAKRILSAGHVYAFEPEPATFSALNRNVKLNHLTNVTTFPFALTDRESDRLFYIRQNTELHSFFDVTVEPYNQALEKSIVVKTHRLDTLVSQGLIRPPTFVKIDVEGAELEVLKGLQGICIDDTNNCSGETFCTIAVARH